MPKLRIVFLGTPEIACGFLSRVAASGHELAGVITQPDRPVGRGLKLCCAPAASMARELCVEPCKPASRKELHEAIAALKPDLCVVVAYGRLIPQETLALARLGFLNVHFSLLPKYRGAAPVQWALIKGEQRTGVTIFWLDRGMDTGPVFLRREEQVRPEDDAASLFTRLSASGAELLDEALRRASAGDITREPQRGEPSLAPKLTSADSVLDFSRGSGELLGLVRGLSCGPRARFYAGPPEKRGAVQVISAAPASGGRAAAPGTVLSIEPGGGIVVKCGVGELLLAELKPEGKKVMKAADFLNGLRLRPGDPLA